MAKQAVDILLVEDDPNDVELTLRTLGKHMAAAHIEVARDGAEALELLLGSQSPPRLEILPRLVLLDLKLPKMDGCEVLRALRGDPRTKTLPVVVLTSSREGRDISECYEIGANSYIVKPVDFAQFSEVIRHLGLYWLSLNERPGERS
jgi:two-component system, response regulator